jgi:RNase H-fold protein (predicted Holliday junction resolvase)
MSYLGLDYGSSHVGIAISMGVLAEPLTTIPTKTALLLIKDLIFKHQIDAMVVGDVDQNFLIKLKEFGLPVYQVDETLSTKDARTALMHTTQTRRKQKEHSVAATIILQYWLDSGQTNS